MGAKVNNLLLVQLPFINELWLLIEICGIKKSTVGSGKKTEDWQLRTKIFLSPLLFIKVWPGKQYYLVII